MLLLPLTISVKSGTGTQSFFSQLTRVFNEWNEIPFIKHLVLKLAHHRQKLSGKKVPLRLKRRRIWPRPSITLPQFTADNTFCPEGKRALFQPTQAPQRLPSWGWKVVEMKVGELNKKGFLVQPKDVGPQRFTVSPAPNIFRLPRVTSHVELQAHDLTARWSFGLAQFFTN